MKPDTDHAIREIDSSRPKLKDGLRMAYREYAGAPGWLVEEPMTGRFFRLGEAERRFIDQLDGKRTVSEAIARLAASGDGEGEALEPGHAVGLIRALTDHGLLATSDGAHAERLRQDLSEEQGTNKLLGAASSALFLRIPLCNPDPFFRWLARGFGWLASPAFALVWLAVVALGIASIAGEWPRFQDQLRGVFDFGNIWLLGLLWIVLKAFHECWHGLVCRRFGGAVPEAGVTLLLFVTPLGYVDASSSTGFPNKGSRMFVAAAGMYGELFLAALAAFAWSRLEPGVMSATLHQVIVISSVTTILFNANPLMRFDGYYLLADWLDIPNLAKRGQAMAGWLTKRYAFGIRGAKYPLREGERAGVIAVYGVLAAAWRVLVIVGLLVAAARMFHGVGLIFAVVAAFGILAMNGVRVVRYLSKAAPAEGVVLWRTGLRCVAILGVLLAILALVRVSPGSRAPAVVRSTAGGEVRAQCPGFLAEIRARPGAQVKAGEVVLRLENIEQQAVYQQALIEVKRSQLRLDGYRASEDIAAHQAERENLAAWEQKAEELSDWVDSLELRAPIDGRVMGRSLDSIQGNWIPRGQMLFAVADPASQELIILVPQDEAPTFQENLRGGSQVGFLPRGRVGRTTATIATVMPTAILSSPHFALTVPGGGPVAVRHGSSAGSERGTPMSGDASSESGYSLIKPHFQVHAVIDNGESAGLADGEIGWVRIAAAERRSLLELGGEWFSTRLRGIADRSSGP